MNRKRKKLFFLTVFMASFLTAVTFFKINVSASNYLETNKNYYQDSAIKKGFLDQPISKEYLGDKTWDMFQNAVDKKLVTYSPGMTFNQYYLANGISPEDNFTVYPGLTNQLVRLPSGGYLNANYNPKGAKDDNGNLVDYITYVGPTRDRGAYWGDKEQKDPSLFSRLTVGSLGDGVEHKLGIFPGGTYKFPTQIGYGESSTVNDYMLTGDNDFVIPTRFNQSRSDVYLTMRSRAYFGAGLQGAQAFLSATSNGDEVLGSQESPEFYIDTNSNVFMTSQGYDQLGTFSKIMANSVYTNASGQLKNIGINNFSNTINNGLKTIQQNSGVNNIVSGNGGQIQLTGFDRKSKIDNNYSASTDDRKQDSSNTTDVSFYMYTSGNNETSVTTPLAPNGYHLYSPNVSNFKIETTRPYFSSINNTAYNGDNFKETLGSNSFSITDNGILPSGDKVGIDPSRVRVRISVDDGVSYSSKSYTTEELQVALNSSELQNKEVTLAYTYASIDAKDENIGLLPNEIKNNTGAYAVPFLRTFINKQIVKNSTVTAKYVDEKGNKIADPVVKSGNVGDEYSTEQKEIYGYTFKEVQGNATGTFTADAQTVTYVYTKNPVTPDSPEKPVIPDNGKTSSTTNNNTTVNNTTNNHFVKTVEKILPKTAAENIGFSAILVIVLSGVTGVIVFKSHRNKQ